MLMGWNGFEDFGFFYSVILGILFKLINDLMLGSLKDDYIPVLVVNAHDGLYLPCSSLFNVTFNSHFSFRYRGPSWLE